MKNNNTPLNRNLILTVSGSFVSYVVAAAVIDPPLNPVLTLGILLVSVFLVALAMLFGR
jgi:hypothetical protein